MDSSGRSSRSERRPTGPRTLRSPSPSANPAGNPGAMTTFSRRELLHLLLGLAGVAAVILTYRLGLETNATTVALSFLLVVLFVAAASRLWVAVVTSVAAMVAFNFFFLPPVGTLTVV